MVVKESNAKLNLEVDAIYPEAAARSAIYGMLSQAFSHPREKSLKVTGKENHTETREYIGYLPYQCEAVETDLNIALQKLDAEPDISEKYTTLFDNCTGRALIALRETEYVSDEAQALWEDLVRFYEHFGVNYSVDNVHLWPDHIVVELDMLCYLSFLEASGGVNRGVFIQAQYDFIERHLKRWVRGLNENLSLSSEAGVYSEISSILSNFISAEEKYLAQVIQDS